MEACGHQAGDVGHIHHEIGSRLVGDLPEPLKVNGSAVGAGSGDDQLRPALHGQLFHLIVINEALAVYAVGHDVEIHSGKIHRTSVGEMAALIQIHAHNRVSRLQHGNEHRHIGLGTGVGLHIGVIAAKQLLCPLYGDGFHHVHILTAAVIPFSRVSFRVFVGEHRAHRHHHRLRHNVLGCDQLQVSGLSVVLGTNGRSYLAVVRGDQIHDFFHHCCVPPFKSFGLIIHRRTCSGNCRRIFPSLRRRRFFPSLTGTGNSSQQSAGFCSRYIRLYPDNRRHPCGGTVPSAP